MVFHFGISARQYSKMSVISRSDVLRRVDVGAAGDVLLEHVVLDRAGELVAGDALLLGDELVEQQQHRRRAR